MAAPRISILALPFALSRSPNALTSGLKRSAVIAGKYRLWRRRGEPRLDRTLRPRTELPARRILGASPAKAATCRDAVNAQHHRVRPKGRRAGVGNAGDAGQQIALALQVRVAVDVLVDLPLDSGNLSLQESEHRLKGSAHSSPLAGPAAKRFFSVVCISSRQRRAGAPALGACGSAVREVSKRAAGTSGRTGPWFGIYLVGLGA